MDQLFNEVSKILAEIAECDIEEVKMDSNLINDLEVNSLMSLEIMVMIEKKFKIKINEDDLLSLLTPGDIIKLIEEKLPIQS